MIIYNTEIETILWWKTSIIELISDKFEEMRIIGGSTAPSRLQMLAVGCQLAFAARTADT
jgi:hypothetical protein